MKQGPIFQLQKSIHLFMMCCHDCGYLCESEVPKQSGKVQELPMSFKATRGCLPLWWREECSPQKGLVKKMSTVSPTKASCSTSRDALYTAINLWAAARGYAFLTGISRKTQNDRRPVTYACDRGGEPPTASNARQRSTTTRRIGCQFSILAKESSDKATWRLAHRRGSEFSQHN